MLRVMWAKRLALWLCLWAAPMASAEEDVRIALSSGQAEARVSGSKLQIFDGDTGRRLAAFGPKTQLRMRRVGSKVAFSQGSRELGRVHRVRVTAEAAIALNDGAYFGGLELIAEPSGLVVINLLPLETYLLGIVGNEMSPNWPVEALKAQAVAARTYAMHRRVMMRGKNRLYDLESTVISQVYKGAARISDNVIEAVRATRGEVMAYNHNLVEALFHSTCGGHTLSAESVFGGSVPYLQGVRCQDCEDSPRYHWEARFRASEVERRLRAKRLIRGSLAWMERREGEETVRVKAGGKLYRLNPKSVRSALGNTQLYSTRFSAKTAGGKVEIEGHGFGHGVGMCQWGAHGMAERGRGYREILARYYLNVVIRKLY